MTTASEITGLPMHAKPVAPAGKPVRRGRGKGKAKGSSHTHLANLTAAHAKGDHAAVKSHAFALIRSLPQQPQVDEPDSPPPAGGATPPAAMSTASPPVVSGPPQTKPPSGFGGGLSKLAGMLTSRKTR